MKNCGSLSYELREFAINLAFLPWLLICVAVAAVKGELSSQADTL